MQNIANSILWVLVITLAISVLRLRNKIYTPFKLTELMYSEFGAPLDKEFPVMQFNTISGGQALASDLSGKKTILLVTSPSCGACKQLYPLMNPFMQKFGDQYRMISIMVGELKEVELFAKVHELSIPIVQLAHEHLETILTDRLPFGYLLSSEGKVISKGLVTSEEHLNLLRTWSPKPPKKMLSKLSFYHKKNTEQMNQNAAI